jgi:hypothetical protein
MRLYQDTIEVVIPPAGALTNLAMKVLVPVNAVHVGCLLVETQEVLFR